MKYLSMLSLIVFLALPMRAAPASAAPLLEDWAEAQAPAAPQPSPVTVDHTDTALLILDIEERTCNDQRPRCLETVPHIADLLKLARSKSMPVVYSQISTPTPILPAVLPKAGEPVVSSSVDKFYATALESILTKLGTKNVIITGTAAHGAVLHTATGAARRGLHVIIPVDCISAATPYTEQAAVWCLIDGPRTRRSTVLTTSDTITIK